MNITPNIVILTGAGISAESGLETFRGSDGTWNKYKVEDVATPEGFARSPDLVNNFYNKRRHDAANARPNKAHLALAKLEKNFPHSFLLVTQNVDDLHERAGSKMFYICMAPSTMFDAFLVTKEPNGRVM